jgi:hypothetical protein
MGTRAVIDILRNGVKFCVIGVSIQPGQDATLGRPVVRRNRNLNQSRDARRVDNRATIFGGHQFQRLTRTFDATLRSGQQRVQQLSEGFLAVPL